MNQFVMMAMVALLALGAMSSATPEPHGAGQPVEFSKRIAERVRGAIQEAQLNDDLVSARDWIKVMEVAESGEDRLIAFVQMCVNCLSRPVVLLNALNDKVFCQWIIANCSISNVTTASGRPHAFGSRHLKKGQILAVIPEAFKEWGVEFNFAVYDNAYEIGRPLAGEDLGIFDCSFHGFWIKYEHLTIREGGPEE